MEQPRSVRKAAVTSGSSPSFQELSKITMPIAFNEPLSFLQRITEYMEHVYLIHRASCQPQPLERMQVGLRSARREFVTKVTPLECLATQSWGPGHL